MLSLFHINTCSLNKNVDELQHLFICTKKKFDIIAIRETRTTKQVSLLHNLNLNNYSFGVGAPFKIASSQKKIVRFYCYIVVL